MCSSVWPGRCAFRTCSAKAVLTDGWASGRRACCKSNSISHLDNRSGGVGARVCSCKLCPPGLVCFIALARNELLRDKVTLRAHASAIRPTSPFHAPSLRPSGWCSRPVNFRTAPLLGVLSLTVFSSQVILDVYVRRIPPVCTRRSFPPEAWPAKTGTAPQLLSWVAAQ
jgi:hypothetical protein